MRFTQKQVAEAKNQAANKAVASVRRRGLFKFLVGVFVGAAAMYGTLRPDDVKTGYQRVRSNVASFVSAIQHG
jgi:hypothetical protein